MEMFLNSLIFLPLFIALTVGKFPELEVDVTDANGVEESVEEEFPPITNASCSKYFDKHCTVKDTENPYCIYQQYKSDQESKIFNLSPRLYKHCKTCGIKQLYKYDRVMNKIYGGRESVPHAWPWIAGLYVVINNANNVLLHHQMVCGASLISEKHAITASHCIIDSRAEKSVMEKRWYLVKDTLSVNFFLRFGDHRRHDRFFEPQIDVPIHRFMIYKSGADNIDGDVAILEFEKPVEFTPEIHPVCLPPPNLNLETETKCIAVGWGLLRKDPPIPAPALQELEIEIVSPAVCLAVSRIFKLDMQVCVYQPEKGVLNGDSGGGLYCKIHPDDEQWYLYGITSYALVPFGVSGFSRVPYYVEWIHKNIK